MSVAEARARRRPSLAATSRRTRSRSYRLFSAVTHGTQWGVTVLFSTKDTADDRLLSEFAVDQGWVDGASLVAGESYAWAVENFVALLGWDEQPLHRWMTEIDAILGTWSACRPGANRSTTRARVVRRSAKAPARPIHGSRRIAK